MRTVHTFYWSADFADGTHLSQFDGDGNEVFVRDFTPPASWVTDGDGNRGLNLQANHFATLEKVHGNVQRISWHPFTEDLKKKIEKKQDIKILLLGDAAPHSTPIPDGFYAVFWRSTSIDYNARTEKTIACYVSDIYLGYLPRTGNQRGHIDHIALKVR